MSSTEMDASEITRSAGGSTRVEYGMLGSIEARRNGRPVDLGGPRPRALLALLLINANSVVSTDRIIDELWGESTGKDPQNALWVTISRLRGALDPDRPKRSDGTVLVTQQPGYMLSVDGTDVDARRFERAATEGRSMLETDPPAASLVLGDALGLWRGKALEEFTYQPFATAEIERLEELRIGAVEDRVDADLRSGRSRELVGELESLVRQHPFRQRMAGHLMLALHLAGRQGDALRAFGALRTRLGEELGLEPSADLARLEERIVLDDETLRRTSAPASVTGRSEPGLSVRGYELRAKIGEGSTGHVYRAFQPSVGREVAIKVIRPELANDPDFIRRFEAEAQVIASLEHPHIVPVFDYWREPDSAYLVMRRYEQGSLADALADGPLPTEQAVSVLSQVGAALAVAHRRGVTHGDVKPENVLIDEDHHAFLADFGMSFVPVANEPAAQAGSPPFTAPEVAASGRSTVSGDIFAFGVLAEHTLRGSVGTGRSLDAPLVGPAADVLARATDPDASQRFDDIADLLDALADAFGDEAIAVASDRATESDLELVNPYRGLRAFSESDAGRFHGRERLVERLLARLGHAGQQGRFVALVGPSGSGKSSVVRAGVVPALRSGAVTGSESWFVTTMLPGRHPFDALDDALRSIAVDPPANSLDLLISDGIASTVEALVPDESAHVVLVVDQLEEVFSQASASDADDFMEALAVVTADRTSRVKVVATLRADFYDRPLRHVAFGELLRLGTEVISPMNAAELDRAITAPANELGVTFDDGLAALIAADMSGQNTALPLLQHALTELFTERTGRRITTEAYHRMGGVSGALVRRADAIYDDFDTDARATVREVFLGLVTVAHGSADTRRRALVSDLGESVGSEIDTVLDAYGRYRLLSFDRDPITRGPSVEIAHEAMLTEWTRLRDWIDGARSDVQLRQRLTSATAEWIDHDRDGGFVLTGAQLARYDGWLARPPIRLTQDEGALLAASAERSDSELRTERRRVTRLRRLVAGVGVGLVLALVGGGLALQQQRRADDEARQAESQTLLATQAAADAESQRELAARAARDAESAATEAESQTLRATQAATDADLATLISRSAAVGGDDPELALLLALEAQAREPSGPTDRAVLSALGDATVASRIATWQPLVDDCIGRGFFFRGADGRVTELATIDGRMLGRDPVTGDTTDSGPVPQPCIIGGTNGVFGLAGAVDGSLVLAGPNLDVVVQTGPGASGITNTSNRAVIDSVDGTFVYDLATGERVGQRIESLFISAGTSTTDGSLFALGISNEDGRGSAGVFAVIDPATGAVITEVEASQPGPLAFDEASGHLIVSDANGVMTVEPRTGEIVSTFPTNEITGYIAVGPIPGDRLALVSRGGIDIVDRESGELLSSAAIQNLVEAFVQPDGLVVTVNDVGQSDVYDLDGNALVDGNWEFDPQGVAAFADGTAATANAFADDGAGFVEVIDLDSGERSVPELRDTNGNPFPAAVVFPESDGFWAVSFPGHVLGRWENGVLVDELFLGSSPDVTNEGWYAGGRRFGDYVAVIGRRADATNEVAVVRLGRDGESAEIMFTAETEFDLVNPDNQLGMAHPTVDGGAYVIDEQGLLRVHDAKGDVVDQLQTPVVSPVSIALDPTGSRLVLSSLDGVVIVVDTDTLESVEVPAPAISSQVAFDAGGSTLIISTWSGEVRLFDVDDGGVPITVWTGSGTFASEPGWYDASTDTVWVTASGRLLQIPLDPAQWTARACSVLDRELTQDEWDRYVPGNEPLRTVCP
ncbi:MAG: BTAD domain-containing putative transcriptional regulator [Ilumatobacter sp.]